MNASQEFKFRKPDGRAIGTQGYKVDREKSSCLTYTGLWRGNKVVALLVAADDFDSMGDELKSNGDFIVKACNSHDRLVAALRAAQSVLPIGRELGLVDEALIAAGQP